MDHDPMVPARGRTDALLTLKDPAWVRSEDGGHYSLTGVVYCAGAVNEKYQYMNIYVPAAYLEGGEVNGYSARTAPVVFENNCMGWNSSVPGRANAGWLSEGFVFVSVGARSRNAENGTGKMPAPAVDEKAAVRYLRLNDAVIPGCKDRIVSVGISGGGQMSSILGASGNMEAYYPYLYEIGAAGLRLEDGKYVSTIRDDIFASMCYCPITDLDNADMAYAWFRFDAGEKGAVTMFGKKVAFNEFQLALQNDLAAAFCRYINSLGLRNAEGKVLSFDVKEDGAPDPRRGSYYDETLKNISGALNAWIATGNGPAPSGGESWLRRREDGAWEVTDLAGFLTGTGLGRNKDIPGFDTFFATEEGNGFGKPEEDRVHFSASVAAVLKDHYDRYASLPGFAEEDADAYIAQGEREDIREQAYLVNSTQIMLGVASGAEKADVARHWRTRNGTADEHTSFSVAYNLCMAALMAGAEDADYSLVWNMPHGADEGTSTGTVAGWVHRICAADPLS